MVYAMCNLTLNHKQNKIPYTMASIILYKNLKKRRSNEDFNYIR